MDLKTNGGYLFGCTCNMPVIHVSALYRPTGTSDPGGGGGEREEGASQKPLPYL